MDSEPAKNMKPESLMMSYGQSLNVRRSSEMPDFSDIHICF